ncbi:MAG: sigma-70 family RNA polymerase sigma factor [Balneolaceae bacterium]|nr:sigma-70 family RNA polymerase sigma factor [Balneolaceae bacterium]
MSHQKGELTAILNSLGHDSSSINKALPLVYDELRNLAHRQLRGERPGHTLNTTALVHEAYMKLINNPPEGDWNGRRHFFGIAARAMRQILVNYALMRSRKKRSGSMNLQPFEDEIYLSEEKAEELIVLDEALKELEKLNERQGRVVECRYFAGYNVEETADILGISPATVKRDWTSARAWLFSQIHG